MKFWEAMKALEQGKKVRCARWDKPYNWALNSKTDIWSDCLYRIEKLIEKEWELSEEPNLNWPQVLNGLKKGKNYRRKNWENEDNFIYQDEENSIIFGRCIFEQNFCMDDFEASDWFEVI